VKYRLKVYVREALAKGHSPKRIIDDLNDAGHSKFYARSITRSVVKEKINAFDALEPDEKSDLSRISRRLTAELIFAVVVRFAIAAAMVYSMVPVLVQQIYG